jgi:hypothetical protein
VRWQETDCVTFQVNKLLGVLLNLPDWETYKSTPKFIILPVIANAPPWGKKRCKMLCKCLEEEAGMSGFGINGAIISPDVILVKRNKM